MELFRYGRKRSRLKRYWRSKQCGKTALIDFTVVPSMGETELVIDGSDCWICTPPSIVSEMTDPKSPSETGPEATKPILSSTRDTQTPLTYHVDVAAGNVRVLNNIIAAEGNDRVNEDDRNTRTVYH